MHLFQGFKNYIYVSFPRVGKLNFYISKDWETIYVCFPRTVKLYLFSKVGNYIYLFFPKDRETVSIYLFQGLSHTHARAHTHTQIFRKTTRFALWGSLRRTFAQKGFTLRDSRCIVSSRRLSCSRANNMERVIYCMEELMTAPTTPTAVGKIDERQLKCYPCAIYSEI